MKKMILIMMLSVCIGISNAALVNNGDFPDSAADWDAAGGPTDPQWGVTHDAAGYLTLDVTAGGWGVWYQTINESLASWGIPAGTNIVMSADIISISGGTDSVALKIEATDGGAANGEYEEILDPVDTSWANYSMTGYITIPAGTDALKCIFVHKGFTTGVYGFDNVEIKVSPTNTALKPVPEVGGVMNPVNDVISWVNPAGTTGADVYILESATPLASPDPRTGTKISTTGESLDLSDNGVTVSAGKFYYWAVDVNTGSVVSGFTWDFSTQEVNAGSDQYVWLTGSPAAFQFTLAGTTTGTPDSVLWEDISNLLEQTPGTTVAVNSGNTATTTVDVDGDGWYLFRYTATYGDVTVSDELNVGVYLDACAAAKADPTDIPASYPDGHGDIDGDCDTDIVDFALLAASWMDCMSNKLPCGI